MSFCNYSLFVVYVRSYTNAKRIILCDFKTSYNLCIFFNFSFYLMSLNIFYIDKTLHVVEIFFDLYYIS